VDVGGPAVFRQQAFEGDRPGGLVAVDAGGQVDVPARTRRMPHEGRQFPAFKGQRRHLPALTSGGAQGGAGDMVDVDSLAVIATVVFAQPLHCGVTVAGVSAGGKGQGGAKRGNAV